VNSNASNNEPLLDLEDISKRFGGLQALKDISLTLYRGEVLALAGDNGAGKSTLIKTISGVHKPDTGSIKYCGKPIHLETPHQARDAGIETIYQDLAIADNLDVGGNVFLGREMVKRICGLPFVDRHRMREEALVTLQDLDIHIQHPENPLRSLSGGQRQSVAIGRAIHWKARVLIMDEPTAALGVPEQRKVMEIIQKLKKSGVGVIFISHNLNDIFQVSDRILVLRRGEKVGERLISETNHDEVVRLMVAG
jgi:simple sugar transport system ATP-binding protein